MFFEQCFWTIKYFGKKEIFFYLEMKTSVFELFSGFKTGFECRNWKPLNRSITTPIGSNLLNKLCFFVLNKYISSISINKLSLKLFRKREGERSKCNHNNDLSEKFPSALKVIQKKCFSFLQYFFCFLDLPGILETRP